MADLLSVIELGDPGLRTVAKPVVDVQSDRVQTLIDQLLLTLQYSNGVGIAAPQVGQGDRLLIVASRPNPRYPSAPEMEPIVMINPRTVDHSGQTVQGWEGCLSVPGVRGFVPRYGSIVVEFLDRWGNLHQQEFTDFVARIFQHELDHLNGLVFLDRVESPADLITEPEFQRLVASLGSGD